MPSVQVQSKIEMEALLRGISKLDTPELEHFQEQVNRLLAQRKAPNLPAQEATLLMKINEGLSSDESNRYNTLAEKLHNENIMPIEHQELLQLTDLIEAKNAQRLQYLIELAQIRGISLDILMTQLGLSHA